MALEARQEYCLASLFPKESRVFIPSPYKQINHDLIIMEIGKISKDSLS
jgi:hypothetical protein